MKLFLTPKAAPPWFPYPDHRDLGTIWAQEREVAKAVSEAYEKQAGERLNARPGPNHPAEGMPNGSESE